MSIGVTDLLATTKKIHDTIVKHLYIHLIPTHLNVLAAPGAFMNHIFPSIGMLVLAQAMFSTLWLGCWRPISIVRVFWVKFRVAWHNWEYETPLGCCWIRIAVSKHFFHVTFTFHLT